MDLWQVLRIVLRRWYVALPALALTALVVIQQPVRMQSEYETASTVILVVPNSSSSADQVPTNAYLSFSGSLSTTAEAINQILDSERVRQDLWSQGLLYDYWVTVQRGGPILRFEALGDDPESVLATVHALRDRARSELEGLQNAVRASDGLRIEAHDLGVPLSATQLQGSISRLFVATIALGLASAVSLALLVEGAVDAHRRRRDGRTPRDGGGGTGSLMPEEEPSVAGRDHALAGVRDAPIRISVRADLDRLGT